MSSKKHAPKADANATHDATSEPLSAEGVEEALMNMPSGAMADSTAGHDAQGDGTQGDGDSLEVQKAALEAQVADLNDRLLRAVAETENIRRRGKKDKEDTTRYAVSNMARELLAVADNLGRALGSVDAAARKETSALDSLMTGIEMTEKSLMTIMGKAGISRMEPEGKPFDPNVHEAMFEYGDASVPAGTVGQVIEDGYMIHDRPLRPAKVGITKGGGKGDPAPNTPDSADADKDPDAPPHASVDKTA